MKKAKNKKQLNRNSPERQLYFRLSKNNPLDIAKAFLLLIQEERENFRKRRDNALRQFNQDVKLYKRKITKGKKDFFVMTFKPKNYNEEKEAITFEFGSEAYFETFFHFFNSLSEEEEEMARVSRLKIP